MISPYDSIAQSIKSDLASLGFQLIEDRSHEMKFQRGNFSLIFMTEQYYHPTLVRLFKYLEPNGEAESFHLSRVMSVVAPELYRNAHYGIETSYEGIKNDVQFEIDFLKKFEDLIFQDPPSYLSDCEIAAREHLKQSGFLTP